MKKWKQGALVVCSVAAVIVYLSSKKEPVQSVMIESSEKMVDLEVVLKDSSEHLIPFTIQSACTTELECLNESISFMSNAHDEFEAVLPKSVTVQSISCDAGCVIDFSKELLEFEPSKKNQVEQVLSYVLDEYESVSVSIDGNPSTQLQLVDEVKLNDVHLLQKDYSRGNLYQMYMSKEVKGNSLIIPVVIHSSNSDALDVIENFYNVSYSVQFDTINFNQVEIIDGDPMQVLLSSECMENHQIVSSSVLPILYSLKNVNESATVQIVVDGVVADEIVLSELRINDFYLFE